METVCRAVCLAVAALLLAGAGARPTVGLKNRETGAVLVELGTRDGVSVGSDFEVVGPDGAVLAILYPLELFEDHFWSQPLSAEAFERVAAQQALRPTVLDATSHARLRREGEARRGALAAEREKARREEVRGELERLRERRRSLLRERDALDDRVSAREKDLVGTEGRADRAELSEEEDVDRSLERLASLEDQREEVQARREVLAEADPYPKDEVARLSAEVRHLDDRMEAERRRIRAARDRRRGALRSFLTAREEWRRLLIDLDDLDRQVQSLNGRIQELERGP